MSLPREGLGDEAFACVTREQFLL
ncbi:hypothetical protein NITMOv2_0016 [Nitrospira moscoviensis]|uniref:Uncharacterized protein n=1 Tax=Nitrospira moscoviensis TaxID=42253 RepID=A0A0K2G6B1_NITMO|nr:hypothetical protein NITMOv2_0016 [Nitrospira moscoviensis]